jgi:uncharacterized protein
MQAAAPVNEGDRIGLIDALRGFALLGILAMNIPGFSMPDYFTEAFHNDPSQLNFWLHGFITVFLEGKMRAMFGMIFGAGILLFVGGKEKAGMPATKLFYRRMGWLALFGLVHAHLILWIGDILYLYAVCGMLVYPLRNAQPRLLAMAVPLVAVVDFTSGTLFYQHMRNTRLAYVEAKKVEATGQALSGAQKKALSDWREMEKTMIPNREDAKENTRKMKGDYASVGGYLRPLALKMQTMFLPLEIWDSVALMMLGMALHRWGFFAGAWRREDYWKVVAVGYGVGLPLVAYSFYYQTVNYSTLEANLLRMERVAVEWTGIIYPFQRMLLVMAHAAALILLFTGGGAQWLYRRLAAVGRMAFTNYIMQSVICTLFFFGYGLNYYAELDYYQIYYVVVSIWVLQLVVSPIWLERFYFGPLEWLWRTLTYGARPRMLRG